MIYLDTGIPESLDYSQHRIAGEKATIIFQSGALAGREFDIEQTDDALTGYIHDERRFKIVPQELDGMIMPGVYSYRRWVISTPYSIYRCRRPISLMMSRRRVHPGICSVIPSKCLRVRRG